MNNTKNNSDVAVTSCSENVSHFPFVLFTSKLFIVFIGKETKEVEASKGYN